MKMRFMRPAVYLLSASVALVWFVIFLRQDGPTALRLGWLGRAYALSALTLLYSAVLISPLTLKFSNIPGKALIVRSRRALGVSAFCFGATHASLMFFGLLGGFDGLRYLSASYLVAISLGATTLLILSLMAVTSFDAMIRRLGKHWKQVHRFVYLAMVTVTIHALLLGSHFGSLTAFVPVIYSIALAVLLVLEAERFDHWIYRTTPDRPSIGPALMVVSLIIFTWFLIRLIAPTAVQVSLHAH